MTLKRLFSSNTKPFKVLICGHHFPDSFTLLKKALSKVPNVVVVQSSKDTFHKELINSQVVIPHMTKIGKKEIEIGKELKLIQQYGVGLEGVDIPTATAANIWVCNLTSEGTGNAMSCAEHAIFLGMSLLRNTYKIQQSLLTGQLGYPMGKTFYKSTAIIYGHGGIGYQLKTRLEAFDMKIIVVSDDHPELHGNTHHKHEDVPGVTYIKVSEMATTPGIKEADVVFICCSQNKDNMGFVNNQFISQLKPGAFLVNIARGGLLNYRDVQDALDSGALGGVGLDVYHTEPFPLNDPFLTHPKVIATPHIAGITEINYGNASVQVAANIQRIINNELPLGNVNTIIQTTSAYKGFKTTSSTENVGYKDIE